MQTRSSASPIATLIDSWALALAHWERGSEGISPLTPFEDPQSPDVMTRISDATIPLLESAQLRDVNALTSTQLHYLFALAATGLLELREIADFLETAIDPGVGIWYQPVSVTALRSSLTEVL